MSYLLEHVRWLDNDIFDNISFSSSVENQYWVERYISDHSFDDSNLPGARNLEYVSVYHPTGDGKSNLTLQTITLNISLNL